MITITLTPSADGWAYSTQTDNPNGSGSVEIDYGTRYPSHHYALKRAALFLRLEDEWQNSHTNIVDEARPEVWPKQQD